MVQVFDQFQVNHQDIYDLLYQKLESGQPITREEIYSIDSIWKYITTPLANGFAVLMWSTVNYMIARILYIIRTPRI
jgi:predicted ABC-type ATPase